MTEYQPEDAQYAPPPSGPTAQYGQDPGGHYGGSPYGDAQYGGYPPPMPPPAAPPAFGGGESGRPASTGRRTILVAALVAALVGGGVGAGTAALVDGSSSSSSNSSGLLFSTQTAPAAKVDGTVSAAAAKIGPSVVTIVVTSGQQQDTGSGVIIRSDGYILTNNHVIAAAAGGGTIDVTLTDGRQASGKVVGTDPSDDLAVVKVALSGLTAATFASSSSLVVGQTVVAVGAPLGLSDTVTSGIVSNTARPVQTGDSTSQAVFDAVQTDAAINPGNSGGPLVNLNGDVVGINAAIATDQSSGGLQVPGQSSQAGNIGIGFAIPSDEASRIANELISTGKSTHALIGVSVTDAASTPSSTATGARLRTVTAGSPAAKAGLQVGDVVTKLDSQRIDTADALVAAVRSHAPGQTVTVTYTRGGTSATAQVTLGSDPN
jgi:putative serine protease PepD